MKINKNLVKLIKKIDKLTNYKIGNIIRNRTNMNTKESWNVRLGSYGEFWRNFTYEFIIEYLPKNGPFSILDIGCALGDGCVLLKKYFPDSEINGADFSNVAIEKAKTKSKDIKFFILDILNGTPPKKYDFIIMLSTLEHFNDPYPIVDKCLNFIEKSLIIVTPYVEEFYDPHLYSKGLHRYLFNENTFNRYNSKILKITDVVESTGHRYIIYKLEKQ